MDKKPVPVPRHLEKLAKFNGNIVPWFVAWNGSVPDFRVIDTPKMPVTIKENLCWICGGKLGTRLVFPIGPMCALTRVISEPPSHFSCADYSVKVCPFLSRPDRTRRETNMMPGIHEAAGAPIPRNPGVTALWVTRSYRPFMSQKGNEGLLFEIGDAEEIHWYCQGRMALRAEVLGSIETGLPILYSQAREEGLESVRELGKVIDKGMEYLQRFFPAAEREEVTA